MYLNHLETRIRKPNCYSPWITFYLHDPKWRASARPTFFKLQMSRDGDMIKYIFLFFAFSFQANKTNQSASLSSGNHSLWEQQNCHTNFLHILHSGKFNSVLMINGTTLTWFREVVSRFRCNSKHAPTILNAENWSLE